MNSFNYNVYEKLLVLKYCNLYKVKNKLNYILII